MPSDARRLLLGDRRRFRARSPSRASCAATVIVEPTRLNHSTFPGSQSAARFFASCASYSAFFWRMPAMTFSGLLGHDLFIGELPLQIGDLLFELFVFFFQARAVHGDVELERERPAVGRA